MNSEIDLRAALERELQELASSGDGGMTVNEWVRTRMRDAARRSYTRPADRVGCYDCGCPYSSPEWVEAAVPHETWAKISPTGHEGGLLCVTCMAKRAAKLGLTGIPAKVWSGPFVFEMGDPRPDRSAEEKAVDLVREWLASSDHPVSDWERSFAAAIITFATTIGSIAAQPCVHCNDTGWVDDENWWPDYPGSSQERVPGNGKIRCGMLCTADTKGESPHGDTD